MFFFKVLLIVFQVAVVEEPGRQVPLTQASPGVSDHNEANLPPSVENGHQREPSQGMLKPSTHGEQPPEPVPTEVEMTSSSDSLEVGMSVAAQPEVTTYRKDKGSSRADMEEKTDVSKEESLDREQDFGQSTETFFSEILQGG